MFYCVASGGCEDMTSSADTNYSGVSQTLETQQNSPRR